jgi:hypothetical protein
MPIARLDSPHAGGPLFGMKKYSEPDGWRILLAEDNDDYALLIEMALDRASSIPVEFHRA